jgi:hypothetical protein
MSLKVETSCNLSLCIIWWGPKIPYLSNVRSAISRCVFVSLFVCLESHEQFFSYLATVTITGDRAANLDLCLALVAFSCEGSFICHTYCDTRPPFLRSYPKDPWFSLLKAVLLAKEQSLPVLNVLYLTRPVRAVLELTTFRLLSESTTTRLLKMCMLPMDFVLHRNLNSLWLTQSPKSRITRSILKLFLSLTNFKGKFVHLNVHTTSRDA